MSIEVTVFVEATVFVDDGSPERRLLALGTRWPQMANLFGLYLKEPRT